MSDEPRHQALRHPFDDGPHPPIAKLIFYDLDLGEPVRYDALPAGIDENTYLWVRELVIRLRRYVSVYGPLPKI